MQSSTWFKKSALALVASILFSMSPSIQAAPWYKSINKKSVAVLAVGGFLIYFFTKQESKDPVTISNVQDRFAAARNKYNNAHTAEEKKAALKEILCFILTATDDIVVGHKGKEKGLIAEGKVRCEGVEEVTTVREDGGQVVKIIKFKDVPPYGLIGTVWTKIQPAVKGLDALGKTFAAFYVLKKLVKQGPKRTFA